VIIAIEGPDGSGKSTVVTHLDRLFRGAQVIQFRETPKEYIQHINILEPFMFQLFAQMYDTAKVYICDRFFSVSSRVYARIRDEKSVFDEINLDAWAMTELHVIYLDQRVEAIWERENRPSSINDDRGNWDRQLRATYKEIAKELITASQYVVDTEGGLEKTVHQVVRLVEKIIGQHVHRHED